MFLDADDLGDDDFVAIPDGATIFLFDAHAFGDRQPKDARAGHFQPGKGEALAELPRGQRERNVIAEPVEGDVHVFLGSTSKARVARLGAWTLMVLAIQAPMRVFERWG